ncbi:flagellar biosynthetic protein FliR [Salipiger mucosus]|uniref:Flagellar biosynthesis protein FliR n=1 Tax=Salipiger mucosus DSM 16094 TaxID=1123237 RepID=S9QMH0_9RHOB|nr:flagellar biosynthetic protein FliR [Salipiger mucosus]EPX82626.1 Flagellar biosynthesis protein FliR [Salipiger mucosus DSM 16094]
MTGLTAFVDLLAGGAWAGLLVFLRVGATMTALPALGEQSLPVRVRLVASLMMTVAILPAAITRIDLPAAGLGSFATALATESVNGLVIGLVLRLFVLALQTAGSIAAQSTSLSQLLGSAGTDPMPAIGHILTIAGLALLMATGFHVKAAALLILSYDLMPALQFPDPATVADVGREQVTHSFALAFGLAAPFVILSALYYLTLGFINKAMPQLMVAFVGAPVITLGSVALLMLTAPIMLAVWLDAVDAFLTNPFR